MDEDPAVDTDTLRRLYTMAPSEFVAARNAIVKERRQARDRDGAAAVAALRKPSAVDVALNLVAVEDPDAAEAFLTAAQQLREAQTAAAEGRSAASTRDALRELRARTAAVVAGAERAAASAGVTGATTAAATARLGELVANEAAGQQLRAGHLGSDALAAVDPFAGLENGAPVQPMPHRRTSRSAPADAPSAPAHRADARAEARRQRLEAALARATEERAAAREDADTAEREVDDAGAALTEAEARLRQAQARLRAAQDASAKASSRLARADAAVAKARAAAESVDG
jgi:hypothetical protein